MYASSVSTLGSLLLLRTPQTCRMRAHQSDDLRIMATSRDNTSLKIAQYEPFGKYLYRNGTSQYDGPNTWLYYFQKHHRLYCIFQHSSESVCSASLFPLRTRLWLFRLPLHVLPNYQCTACWHVSVDMSRQVEVVNKAMCHAIIYDIVEQNLVRSWHANF